MDSLNKCNSENTSTPKRRRLGTSRVLRKEIFNNINSPVHSQISATVISSSVRCESPPLPCNQVEYLYESTNKTSSIPSSPDVLESPIARDIHDCKDWQSLALSNINLNNVSKDLVNNEDDISNDMFNSRLEHELDQNNHADDVLLTSHCEKAFKDAVEETFDLANQSICDIQKNQINKSSLFETKDSFLLDIKESGILAEEKEKINNCVKFPDCDNKVNDENGFYGLPLVTKSLFKTFRNIEKFYDWQEECLNLDAVKERRNLIYALPTSGGKTLVAEVLMLREVLNRKHNALFILPFVAIVQEKIWSLSPFAVKLNFLVEEYAAGKGHLPPKKRRKKNSIYIATIEKGLVLIRSLIELDRLDEIGLIVVDELHLIGEPGRGGTLESLLTTVIFANKGIQIVGMSATIGNLEEIGEFLHAEVFQREFRPVELAEYVKLGDVLYALRPSQGGDVQLEPVRQLCYDYSPAATSLDPDWLGGLVSEVVPQASCLVFCPTKRNCENVATLLCKFLRGEMRSHRSAERAALCSALRAEGAGGALLAAAARGVAAHHAGLSADERLLIEHAFRSGVVSVVCCTSTLAAGVNLPAQRVIIRAPHVGSQLLSLAAYRQMVGRAGRAGVCQSGESILICSEREWGRVRAVLCGGVAPARSTLRRGAADLLLSGAALRLARTRPALRRLLACSLLAKSPDVDVKEVCDETLRYLLDSGALEVSPKSSEGAPGRSGASTDLYVYDDSELVVSTLGIAAIKGGMDLNTAKQLLEDINTASKSLVLTGSLHLLYLVTPHDGAGIKPDYRHYYSLYTNLEEAGVRTARVLGITEVNAVRMMTGKPITNVPEKVLRRFYLAMMMHDLWNQTPFHVVADKYGVGRGAVQSVAGACAAQAACAARACAALPALWACAALLAELAPRLQHAAAPELQPLMELPAVKKARALQLLRAGYKRIEDLAKASPDELMSSVSHLSRTAANQLISAARMQLIEKVENLRAEAEEVMEGLNL